MEGEGKIDKPGVFLKKSISDREVIDSLQEGTKSEVNEIMRGLYLANFPSIERFVLNNSGRKADAADVFQDAMVVLYLKIRKGEYENKSSIKTYLFAIAKRIWLKKLRRQRLANQQEPPPLEVHQEETFIQGRQVTIRKLLEQMDVECKQLLMSFYFGGLSVSELTAKFDLGSEGALRNKKYRCMQKLISLVKRHNLDRSDFDDE